ncbi:hypothetical protein FSARC_5060 [Fusarium sarcochroum]|uniref:Uncharacterized protein n=1 Tax=Fusarium sarcochroum TaxID=1208366 RepID=A0A8H4XAU4_9HYPO|nr:hypothetical protein FSARC_5060 [Fusarium sarcochroum]
MGHYKYLSRGLRRQCLPGRRNVLTNFAKELKAEAHVAKNILKRQQRTAGGAEETGKMAMGFSRKEDDIPARATLVSAQSRWPNNHTNEQLEQTNEQLEQTNEHLEQENQLQQGTDLTQYLEYCHLHLFQALTIRPNASSTSVTKVNGKFYPLRLRPWTDFVAVQQHQFQILKEVIGNERAFTSYVGVREMARRACETPVASEEDIKPFEHIAVEGPVTDIFRALCARPKQHSTVTSLNMPRISFANYSVSLDLVSDGAARSIAREHGGQHRRNPSPTKRVAAESQEIRPDRRCIRQDLEGNRAIAFVVEYKAAHQLQAEKVRQSLHEDLMTSVVKRRLSTRSTSDEAQAKEDRSDDVLAMALTQTFDYMIRLGLEYSYLTAGKSFLFLRIKADDPRTLYYHLADPDADVHNENGELDYSRTAVGQVAGFTLLALQSEARTRSRVANIRTQLNEWPIPYPEAEHETTDEEELSQTPSHSSDQTYPHEQVQSPERKIVLRSQTACKEPGAACSTDDDVNDPDDQNNPSSHGASDRPTTKRKDGPSSGSEPSSSSSSRGTSGGGNKNKSRQYCTMACLLSLKRGKELDMDCPNVASHQTETGSTGHPISFGEMATLMRSQMASSLDQDCEPLEMKGKYGAVGTLFKLSLTRYGYTFVGKGTIQCLIPHLTHEAQIYEQLDGIQGEYVPVYLGSLDLVEPYHLTARNALRFAGTEIVHMLLMSWAGEAVTRAGESFDFAEALRQPFKMVAAERVWYEDVKEANLVWNEEHGRFIMIDFHSADIIASPRNKRL